MALDRTAIEDALWAWLVEATGLPEGQVIHENQNAPQPPEPYVVVNADLATKRLGMFDEERLTDDPGVVERIGRRRVTVSVNVYGDEPGGRKATEIAESAVEGLQSYSVRDKLRAGAGLAHVDSTDVRDMAQLEETRRRPRAQFDAFFYASSSVTEDVGWVEGVGISAETPEGYSPSDPLVYTATLEL